MTWVDIAGRLLIGSIGIVGGAAIFLFISDKVITSIINHFKFTEILFSYAVNRKKFKEWQKEQKKKDAL